MQALPWKFWKVWTERLDKYAELVLAGKEPVAGKSAATAAPVGYDVELERQRLDFQMKQLETETYDRDEQRKIRGLASKQRSSKGRNRGKSSDLASRRRRPKEKCRGNSKYNVLL